MTDYELFRAMFPAPSNPPPRQSLPLEAYDPEKLLKKRDEAHALLAEFVKCFDQRSLLGRDYPKLHRVRDKAINHGLRYRHPI